MHHCQPCSNIWVSRDLEHSRNQDDKSTKSTTSQRGFSDACLQTSSAVMWNLHWIKVGEKVVWNAMQGHTTRLADQVVGHLFQCKRGFDMSICMHTPPRRM